MTTWYTSDTHFSHARIIELCGRPFKDTAHMNEVLINNWNESVMPDDTIYHLGDLALGDKTSWPGIFSRLNGHKILIVGNHDALFTGNKARYIEKYSHLYDKFDEVYHSGSIVIDGQHVLLSHFPYDGDSHGEDRYSEYRLPDEGHPLVHGHTHDPNQWFTLSKKGTPMFHVGVDAHNYRPVHESVITDWLESL